MHSDFFFNFKGPSSLVLTPGALVEIVDATLFHLLILAVVLTLSLQSKLQVQQEVLGCKLLPCSSSLSPTVLLDFVLNTCL
jgi:hypothetical protein